MQRHLITAGESPSSREPPEMFPRVARQDPGLCATLGPIERLHFGVGPNPSQDLPGHVRAGSALRSWGPWQVVVQDDVHALALRHADTGAISSLLLPRAPDGRRIFDASLGNKGLKMDLEACVVLPDGRLMVLGSGSRPTREQVVVVEPDLTVQVVAAPDLYARLRADLHFATSELNLEGAVVVGGSHLRLFQRSNGTARGSEPPRDAWGDLDLAEVVRWLAGDGPAPGLEQVVQVDLGETQGVRLGFTDAALMPDGRLAFLAGAEASPDAYQDGVVVGSRFGIIDSTSPDCVDIRTTDVSDATGELTHLKLEGLELHATSSAPGAWTFLVVADMDDPHRPAELATLEVRETRAPREQAVGR